MREGKKKISLAALAGLAVFFGVILAISAAFSFYCIYTGMFSLDLEAVLRRGQQNLQSGYSKDIYNQMMNQGLEGYMEDSNLKYVVIKGRELSDEVLSNKENYVYTNIKYLKDGTFREDVRENYTCREKFTTEYIYQFHRNLLRSIGDSGVAKNQYLKSGDEVYGDSLEKILFYNQKNKILYFVGEVQMYPVKRIEVANKSAWTEASRRKYGMGADTISSYTLTYSADGEGRYQMWGEPRLSLNLDNFREWGEFKVESDISYRSSSDSIVTVLENPKPVFENPLDKADGGFWIEYFEGEYGDERPGLMAWYKGDVDLSVETWWVLSYVEEELNSGADDLFVSQKNLITVLFNLRYGLLGLTVLSVVGVVICFIQGYRRRFANSARAYLQGSAPAAIQASVQDYGRRDIRNSERRMIHRIPGLFYLGIVSGAIIAVAKVGSIGWKLFWGYGDKNTSAAYEVAGGILLVSCIALGVFVLWEACGEVAYRAGVGSLWKNTVAYGLGKCLAEGIRKARDTMREHGSLMAKAVLLMFVLAALEFLCMLLFYKVSSNIAGNLALLFGLKVLEMLFGVCIVLQMKKLQARAQQMAEGDLEGTLDNSKMFWEFKKHGDYLNQINDGMSIAIEERLKSEHLRTELIANVSHDVNTPLTSIINYVDLLKKENLQEPRAREYLEVLDRQSARLKKLIQDLMEASKAYTGNLTMVQEVCDVNILLTQALGEFEEKMEAAQLTLLISKPKEEMLILADNRYLWRIFDNLMRNICKYSQPETRVYINLEKKEEMVCIIFRNISRYQLNISSEELLERFVRGDSSRNTEGNGLGLSIVQKLAELMGGRLTLTIDGDLFKAMVFFPQVEDELRDSSV